MLTKRPDVLAYALAALVVIAIVVLAALHADVPAFLYAIGLTAVGGGAGSAVPTAAAAAPAAVVQAPAVTP